jgi:hypothetical protein
LKLRAVAPAGHQLSFQYFSVIADYKSPSAKAALDNEQLVDFMKKLPLFLICAILSIATLRLGLAEEIKSGMNALLAPLSSLEEYIADQDAFSDPRNAKNVSALLQTLRKNFHSLETVPSKYHAFDGFDLALQQVSDILDDSSRRLNEGRSNYAWWRLRTLSSSCFACHATYKVSSSLSAPTAISPNIEPIQQARFMLATRQFTGAVEKLREVIKDPESRFFYDEALRSLLLIETRIEQKPAAAIKLFQEILATAKLSEEDIHQVRIWIEGLKRWKSAPQDPSALLRDGEQLIVKGATKGIDFARDDVALLRGTALIHQALESGHLSSEQRSRSLYLLGFAYEQVPLYFAESWTEMYLEQCIHEYPGSADAKRAYRTYREHIIDDFTGSGGTDIPDEVALHLEELRKKAFGEPAINGKV